jgi:hypothetical protein
MLAEEFGGGRFAGADIAGQGNEYFLFQLHGSRQLS